jgi:hypothetical protein
MRIKKREHRKGSKFASFKYIQEKYLVLKAEMIGKYVTDFLVCGIL